VLDAPVAAESEGDAVAGQGDLGLSVSGVYVVWVGVGFTFERSG
jgi:hypothetical protein